MKIITKTILILLFAGTMFAQQDWGYTPYGYVKTDVMMDSRQVVTARDGQVLLFPANRLEANGEDANEGSVFNILAIQSRFGFKIKAPDFLGAKATGLMEGEFFGSTNADIGSLRLRHAFVNLDWGSHELRTGHDWHPMFLPEAFAKTVSFNTGVPFVPFGRYPQITYTYKTGDFKALISALAEMEFASNGPVGQSTNYFRNSGKPMFNLGLKFDDATILIASNLSFMELKPRLFTEKGFKDDNVMQAFMANFLTRYTSGDFFITASAIYGQNAFDHLMIGGYAVKSVDDITGAWEYTPINTGSVWLDTQYGKELSVGIFGGYSKNYGADDEIAGNYYSRGQDIDYLYRLSPRIAYKVGKAQIAAELEYTAAAYGQNDSKGNVLNSKEVANLRILLAAYIYF
jgi:hypothetical protein